jgi:hypothetical protein
MARLKLNGPQDAQKGRPARPFQFSLPLFRGVAEAALYCAHRTSTVSSCAFCEQKGHLAAPLPLLAGFFSILLAKIVLARPSSVSP